MASLIEEAKSRFDIFFIFQNYGYDLRGSKTLKRTRCPKHKDREPSLTIRAATQRFHCYSGSCGWRGDILELVQYHENLPGAYEAAQSLLEKTRMGSITPSPPISVPEKEEPDRRLLTIAAQHYNTPLTHGVFPHVHRYLAHRGIRHQADIQNNMLGYCSSYRTGLEKTLTLHGFTAKNMLDSGLFIPSRSTRQYESSNVNIIEKMVNRVLVPDIENYEVSWIVGRRFESLDNKYPKYLAVEGTPPDAFGAGQLPPTAKYVVMAEGIFDYLLLRAWGYHAVSSMGSDGLKKASEAVSHIPIIVLAYDNDEAGLRATKTMEELNPGRTIRITLPDGANDIGDLATISEGRAKLRSILNTALIQGVGN